MEYVLAVTQSNYQNGQKLILWEFHSDYADQKFKLRNEQYWHIGHLTGMVYVVKSLLNSDYVLAVCSTPGNNSDVVIQRYTGSENQKRVIFSTDSKFYTSYKNSFDHKK